MPLVMRIQKKKRLKNVRILIKKYFLENLEKVK